MCSAKTLSWGSASSAFSAASSAGSVERFVVPLIGRASTRRSLSTERKRSGEELTTATSPSLRKAAKGAGLVRRRLR